LPQQAAKDFSYNKKCAHAKYYFSGQGPAK